MTSQSKRIVVIGGGISGLSAALQVANRCPEVELRLLESSPRLGGVIQSVKQDGFLVETSADNFITNVPWALNLCRDLGLEEQLAPTNDSHRRAFVVCRGRLEPIPPGFLVMAPSQIGPVLKTPILSWGAKMRLAFEYFVPARDSEDESLASFASRRLGRETYERLVQPLVGGIYTADPEKLSIRASMARFRDMEREHGSMIRAMRRQQRLQKAKQRKANRDKSRQTKSGASSGKAESGARYTMFTTPRGGLTNIVEAIASKLPPDSVQLNSPVKRIHRLEDGRWQVNVSPTSADSSNTESAQSFEADAVVLAAPSRRAAEILSETDATLSDELGKITHASCAVVSLGYRRDQIDHPMDGFGFVVPIIENRRVLSVSFSSVKYAGRAPEDCELIRVFIGGACQPELADLPDDELIAIATEELADLLSAHGEPIFQLISRWPSTMPQYHVGHNALVERIMARVSALPGLALAGNAYDGVGIPHCIHSGQQAADQVLAELGVVNDQTTSTQNSPA